MPSIVMSACRRIAPALALSLSLLAHEPHGPVPAASYSLQFSAQPTAVVAPATFSTTITVINTTTGLPEAPVPSFSITLSTQGVGRLLGTTTLPANAATVTFTGLSYEGLENTTLLASAPGVTSGVSLPIDFDQPQVEASFPPTQSVVDGFFVPVTFKSKLHPAAAVSVTGLQVSVLKTAGSGSLYGFTSQVVTGAAASMGKLVYDAWDTCVLRVVTPYSEARAAVPMTVTLGTPYPTAYFVPNSAASVTVTVSTALGQAFPVTGSFLWGVISGATVLQAGVAPVTNASSFVVTTGALAAGTYQFLVLPASGEAISVSLNLQSLTDFPGPVVQLRPGRVGTPYAETVSGVVTGAPTAYQLASGSLPVGLSLDGVTGAVTGTPKTSGTSRFTIVGQVGALYRPMRCTLSVFTAGETEWVSGQNFGFTGATPPYTSTSLNEQVSQGSTFDNGNPSFQMRVYYPTSIASITTPLPVLVLQHGRGFDHTEYSDVLGRIARWGFICVSSGDYYSFFGNTQPSFTGTQPYETPTQFAEGGMESASGTQERLIRRMIVRNRTVGDTFFGKVDESKLFVAGHSRGGGAIHAAQSRGFNFKLAVSAPQIPAAETTGLAGYIGLMPFDLWYFASCQPPSIPGVPSGIGAQPYNIARNLRRMPGMVFASELDGDLVYPICDQLAERRSSSTCFLTIWGGNHNNTGDAHAADATSSITALQQRNILVQWMTAFLLRYGYDRLDLEGHLFGPEHAQSSSVGRVGFRDVSEPLMVLDGQNANVALNTLGLANVASAGITAALADPYPAAGSLPNATPRSVRLTFTTTGAGKTFRTTVSSVGLDVAKKRRLIFEIRQSGTTGFSWVSIGARLTDINANTAVVSVYDAVPTPDVSTFLPIYPIPGHTSARPLNRFLQVEVPLSSFGGVDLTQLASITLEFNNTTIANNILIDDVRIE